MLGPGQEPEGHVPEEVLVGNNPHLVHYNRVGPEHMWINQHLDGKIFPLLTPPLC